MRSIEDSRKIGNGVTKTDQVDSDKTTFGTKSNEQQELLSKLQLKTRAVYLESQLDRFLDNFASEEHEIQSQMSSGADTIKSDVDISMPPRVRPSLGEHDLSQIVYIASECQRVRLITALHQLESCTQEALSAVGAAPNDSSVSAHHQLRNRILEIPLATKGVIGLYGEELSSPEAIQENYSYLCKLATGEKDPPDMHSTKKSDSPERPILNGDAMPLDK